MKVTTTSPPDRIMRRARSAGRGGVFTPSDFLDIAGLPLSPDSASWRPSAHREGRVTDDRDGEHPGSSPMLSITD